VLFQSENPPASNSLVKRPHEEDDEIQFTGAVLPPDGIVNFGKPLKRRRIKDEKRVEEEDEGGAEEDEEESQLQEVDETLQAVEPLQRGCQACGCFCNTVGKAPRNSGPGSTTLSPRVLGDLLRE
jgi:hypothetical protein